MDRGYLPDTEEEEEDESPAIRLPAGLPEVLILSLIALAALAPLCLRSLRPRRRAR